MANNAEDCLELILNDIVEVRLFPATSVTMPIPVNVPQIASMTLTVPTSVTLDLTVSDNTNANAQMTEEPSLKVSESTKKAGIVYSHEISCTIEKGMDTIRQTIKTMKSSHHYMALRLADGTWRLCYLLPNTLGISLEDTISNGTLKISGSSMSSVIKLA